MKAAGAHPFALIRGEIVPIEQAQVSIMTNGLQYGIGVFDGLRAYKTDEGVGIFRLYDHLQRFAESIKILRMPFLLSTETVRQQMLELARKNNLTGATYIRPLIYRSDLAISPGIAGEYDLAIYMLPLETSDKGKGITATVSSWQRNADNALPPRTKATGGYLNSALALHDARTAGFDSAILLDGNGNVSEGAVMNLFIVKNGSLLTPATDSDILEGVTRRTIKELADQLGISVQERTITRSELYTADEVFFCGTAAEISWCKSIDGVEISSRQGKITTKIHSSFVNLPKTHTKLFTKI